MNFLDYTYQIVNNYLSRLDNSNNISSNTLIDDYEDFIYEIIINELSVNQNKYNLKMLIDNNLKNEDYWLCFLLNEYFNHKNSHQLINSLIKDFNLFNLDQNINYYLVYKKIIDNKTFLNQVLNKLDVNLYTKIKKIIKNNMVLMC